MRRRIDWVYLVRGWIATALGLLLAFGVAGSAAAKGLEGKPAPKLELKGADGQPHTLASIAAGRPTIVLFWASWCPYCEALMPHLQKLMQAHGDDVAIVAISVWEEQGVDPFAVMRERGFPFVVLARGDKQTKKWGVKGTPGLFVLDRKGIVVFDRNARPFNAPAADPNAPALTDRRTGIERSARMWAEAVEATLAQQMLSGP